MIVFAVRIYTSTVEAAVDNMAPAKLQSSTNMVLGVNTIFCTAGMIPKISITYVHDVTQPRTCTAFHRDLSQSLHYS